MTNWQPKLFGGIMAVGMFLAQQTGPPWLITVGKVLEILGAAMLGGTAKQYNVTHVDGVPQKAVTSNEPK